MNDAVNMRTICQTITMPNGGDVHLVAPPPNNLPSLVATQTIEDRNNDQPVRFGGAI